MDLTSKSVTRESLRETLKDFAPIPEAHRLMVWKTILDLPGNKNDYVHLREKGKKTKFELRLDLDETSRKKTCRVICSLLAHCPTLGEFSSFDLAGFVGAFAHLLSSNELIYFEVVLTILGK